MSPELYTCVICNVNNIWKNKSHDVFPDKVQRQRLSPRAFMTYYATLWIMALALFTELQNLLTSSFFFLRLSLPQYTLARVGFSPVSTVFKWNNIHRTLGFLNRLLFLAHSWQSETEVQRIFLQPRRWPVHVGFASRTCTYSLFVCFYCCLFCFSNQLKHFKWNGVVRFRVVMDLIYVI